MAADGTLPTPALQWVPSLVRRAPVTPPWVGLAVALVYLALFFAYARFFGLSEAFDFSGLFWERALPWGNLVTAVLLGYLACVPFYQVRGLLRDLTDLTPALVRAGLDPDAVRSAMLELDPARRRRIGIVVVLLLLATVVAAVWAGGLLDGIEQRVASAVLELARSFAVLWMAFRFTYLEVRVSRALSRLGERIEPELFDPDFAAPYTRHGLRSAFLGALAFGVFSLYMLSPPSHGDMLGMVGIPALLAFTMVAPVRGVHRRMREHKRTELARVREALQAARTGFAGSADRLAERVAPLLQLEERLERVREWPFDAFVYARFVLYAAIGVASWLGAAVVERLLDWVLR